VWRQKHPERPLPKNPRPRERNCKPTRSDPINPSNPLNPYNPSVLDA
jgi:hypothetical protein